MKEVNKRRLSPWISLEHRGERWIDLRRGFEHCALDYTMLGFCCLRNMSS